MCNVLYYLMLLYMFQFLLILKQCALEFLGSKNKTHSSCKHMPQRNTPTKTKRLTHCFPVARTCWYHGSSSWKRVFLIVLPSAFYSGLVTTGSFLEPIQNAFKWLKPWHPLTKVCALVNSKFLLQRLSCLRIKLPSVVITVHTVWLESLKFITKKCRGWVRKKE